MSYVVIREHLLDLGGIVSRMVQFGLENFDQHQVLCKISKYAVPIIIGLSDVEDEPMVPTTSFVLHNIQSCCNGVTLAIG